MSRSDDLAALSLQTSFGIDEALSETPTDKTTFRPERLSASVKVPFPLTHKASVTPSPPEESSSPMAEVSRPAHTTSATPPLTPKSPRPDRPSAPEKKASFPLSSLQSPSVLRQSAFELAQSAKSLEELRHLIETFEGCDLKKTAISTVFRDGVEKAPVMCVGEAPGADEDRLGKPFVGLSGQLLDKMLATIGLARTKNVCIGNIIPWRPPGNRTPTPQESALCLPFIERHIELAQPEVLVFLGGTAAKTLLNSQEPLSRLRNKWHSYHSAGLTNPIPARVFFHPAYLLRSPGQKKLFWADLLTLESRLLDHHLLS